MIDFSSLVTQGVLATLASGAMAFALRWLDLRASKVRNEGTEDLERARILSADEQDFRRTVLDLLKDCQKAHITKDEIIKTQQAEIIDAMKKIGSLEIEQQKMLRSAANAVASVAAALDPGTTSGKDSK